LGIQTGSDWHGVVADPLFVDAAHNNYHLAANSPGIDAGDPASPFSFELGPNGGRVNVGYDGNTAQATASAVQTLQLQSLTGLEKLETGVPVNITFQTDGVATEQPVLFFNVGGPAVQGPRPGVTGAPILPLHSGSHIDAIDGSGDQRAYARRQCCAGCGVCRWTEIKFAELEINLADGDYVVQLQMMEKIRRRARSISACRAN